MTAIEQLTLLPQEANLFSALFSPRDFVTLASTQDREKRMRREEVQPPIIKKKGVL